MRVYCLDLEIRCNTLFLLHVLKDLTGLLFFRMLCAIFHRIFVMILILLTLSAICVFCFILNFMQSVFIYPASAATHNKQMCTNVYVRKRLMASAVKWRRFLLNLWNSGECILCCYVFAFVISLKR